MQREGTSVTQDFMPLKGIRVVEVSHMVFGPSCGMFLAFLGAEVIKVEPPGGDRTRELRGMGASFFPTLNRGKKSVVLDLSTLEGRAALDKLLATSDALIENFRDASLERMGLEPTALRKRHPKLITVACKGFLHGPYEHRTALDEVVQMMTGLAYMTGPVGNPLRVGSSVNDIMGGLFGAYAVVAALKEREQTGVGREVRVGLFENSLLLVAQHMVQFELLGIEPPPMPNRDFSWPVYDIFQTGDGSSMFIGAVTEKQWSILCRLLDLRQLLDDPRLQIRTDQIEARSWTIPVFREAVAQKTSEFLVQAFEAEGIPFAPIARPAEMYDDPQASWPDGMPASSLPDGGSMRAPGMPVEINKTRVSSGLDVPALGNATSEVLESLGLGQDCVGRQSADPQEETNSESA